MMIHGEDISERVKQLLDHHKIKMRVEKIGKLQDVLFDTDI